MAQKSILLAAAVLWIGCIAYGLHSAAIYANTPGPSATTASQWPAGSIVPSPHNRARLLIFAHPQCPCSRATISELAIIMAQCQGKAEAYVLFLSPQSQTQAWVQSALWRDAAAIPGVRVMEDREGREARRFGASTSGQTLLYDASGRLLFNGGITIARGHAGENDGADAVMELLRGADPAKAKTPVFGCSLRDERTLSNALR